MADTLEEMVRLKESVPYEGEPPSQSAEQDEATQRSKKAIDTMVLESKRRIERLAMVTLPDRMFHFLKWTALMLVLFILVHIVWQMFS